MVNYKKSYIYKLCCKDPSIKDCYVGSTTNIIARKNRHKTRANKKDDEKHNNAYVYRFIRDNGGWDNWSLSVLQEVSCSSRLQLCKIEREWLEKLEATLNKNMPYTSEDEKKEYQKNYHKTEQFRESKKKYYEKNKEKIKKYKSIKITCVCGSNVVRNQMKRHYKTKKHMEFVSEFKKDLHDELKFYFSR